MLHVIGQLILTFSCDHAGWDYFAWSGICSTWYRVKKKSQINLLPVWQIFLTLVISTWIGYLIIFTFLRIQIFTFVCLHVFIFTCVCMYRCVEAKRMVTSFLSHFLPDSFFLSKCLSLYISLLIQTGWQAGLRGLPVSVSPALGWQVPAPTPFLVWVLGILTQVLMLV